MAKRKKRGAAFGNRNSGNSQLVVQKRERNRVGMYALFGVLGLLVLCLVIWMSSGGLSFGGNSAETESGLLDENLDSSADAGESGFEASSDSVDAVVTESDEGFAASSDSTEIEPIDAGEFSLMKGDFAVVDLDPVDRNGFYDDYPAYIINEKKTYEAVIVTEKGDIRVHLFTQESPLTVNNFVFLAQDGFYDQTTFHRVLEGFMAQAGDPTGTGTGDPGYKFEDETDNGLAFDRGGLLAMANSGPATNGSQFFITFSADSTAHLSGLHTIFGEIIEGRDVLDAIRLRNPGRDPEAGDLIETIEIYVTD